MRYVSMVCVWLCVVGVGEAQRPGAAAVLNQPYVALGTETTQVKRADGTMVEHVTPLLAARDSAGRTWIKRRLVDPRHPLSPEDRYQVTRYDPQVRALESWCTCDGVVRVTHLGRPKGAMDGMSFQPGSEADEVRTANLPTKTILGEVTRGYKLVGAGGGEWTQGWYSPELGLALKTIEVKPETGTHTMEFRELKREEPVDGMFYSAGEELAG